MMRTDPGERALSVAEYLLGVLELAVIVVAVGYAARQIRRAALPAWSGPPAWVAEAVVALSLAIVLGEALGTFGAFTSVGYVAGSLAAAALAALASRRVGERDEGPAGDTAGNGGAFAPPAPPRYALWLAAGIVAVVVAGWLVPTLSALTGGMGRADTLWYHMPLSLRFVETGSTGELFFFDPIFFAQFYPANTELLHALGILAFGRDLLSPLVNLGFLGLALLAGWAIGRPYGVAPHALVGAAVVLGAETMVSFQAGEALNDVAGVAFLLCSVALLVNVASTIPDAEMAPRRNIGLPAIAIAGASAGLAAGTKLSFLAPVAILTVAVVVVVSRGRRVGAAAAWLVPMLVTGGYWYLRNLVHVGNPIPFTGFGPLGLLAPERAIELRPGFSVAHYWDDPSIWQEWFAPQLAEELGILWPAILLAVAGASFYALWRGREPLLRALGGVVLLTAIAYVFTPLTAGGEEGEPIAFEWNIRYLTPAIAIALALLPCLPAVRRIPRRRTVVLAGLTALATATTLSIEQWGGEFANRTSAAALGVVLFGSLAFAIVASARGWRTSIRRHAAWALPVVLAGAVGAGYLVQDRYLERRYEHRGEELRLAEAVRWAQDIQDARIAVSGVRGVYNQYVFAGADLSNHVQWLGERTEHDGFERIATCAGWREALNRGAYDYVVTMYDPYDPGELTDTKEALWTRVDPHAREVHRDGPVSVFELVGPLSPDACGDLPDLEPAELNGDSVNLDPLANQPPAAN